MEEDVDSLVALYIAGLCGIGYGLRQIIEAQAAPARRFERIVISGGAGRSELVRQLLADATGKEVAAPVAEEPVLLGSAILGAVAAGVHPDSGERDGRDVLLSARYRPDTGTSPPSTPSDTRSSRICNRSPAASPDDQRRFVFMQVPRYDPRAAWQPATRSV